jgi:hypothetical protein
MRIPSGIRSARRLLLRTADAGAQRLLLRGIAPRALPFSPRPGRPGDAPGARRPHVLIARYKYYASDASMGDSIEAFFVDNTLAASGLATFDTFFWDTDYTGFPRGDWAFLNTCRASRPDVLVLSSYAPGFPSCISVETLRLIRERWRIPVVALWWDACWEGFLASLEPIMPYVDVHVVLDDPTLTCLRGRDVGAARSRFLPLYSAMDPLIYTNPGRTRDVDTVFLGQVTGQRSPRLPYIQRLMEKNVPIYCSMTDRSQQPSHRTYVDLMQRAKIGVNFSHGVSWHCLKARVFETMACGAMLMESENPQTAHCFTPMRDYVSFESPDDLVTKVRYYLAHEDERQQIAAQGERRMRETYNHLQFWNAIFGQLAAGTGVGAR